MVTVFVVTRPSEVVVLVAVTVLVVLLPVLVEVIVVVPMLGSATSRFIEVYVRLSHTVPAGTTGGSVSCTMRTEGAPNNCWELVFVDGLDEEIRKVAAARPPVMISAMTIPRSILVLYSDMIESFSPS